MTKIYTMQNDNGDRGWIQYIENGREIDEVMGGPATMINPEFNKCYTIIDEKEYDIMIKLHELYGESQNEKYLDMLYLMIDATLEKNKHRTL